MEHRVGIGSKFTSRYNLKDLLYFETLASIQDAIDREKQLKNWRRDWKWKLIKESNPELNDLAKDWYSEEDLKEVMDSETSSA